MSILGNGLSIYDPLAFAVKNNNFSNTDTAQEVVEETPQAQEQTIPTSEKIVNIQQSANFTPLSYSGEESTSTPEVDQEIDATRAAALTEAMQNYQNYLDNEYTKSLGDYVKNKNVVNNIQQNKIDSMSNAFAVSRFSDLMREAVDDGDSASDAANYVMRNMEQQYVPEDTYIVGNTFQRDDDGTLYGVGKDGKTYRYQIINNTPTNISELTPDEQKEAIYKLTNGRIVVDDSIQNQEYLTNLHKAVRRMEDYKNGALTTDYVDVKNPQPEMGYLRGIMGLTTMDDSGSKDDPTQISLYNTEIKGLSQAISDSGVDEGFWAGKIGEDSVPSHELSHAAQAAYDDAALRQYDNSIDGDFADVINTSQENEKYSTEDIIGDALSKTKYAIPVLMDKIFGTNMVPTEDEWNNMEGDDYEYWSDYFKKMTPVDYKGLDSNEEKARKIDREKDASGDTVDSLFEEAAKNTGFDSVGDAVQSVSGYAAEPEMDEYGNEYPNYAEAFAEAYTDVLINAGKAKSFSKELIRLYTDAAERWSKKTIWNKSKQNQSKQMKQLLDMLPTGNVNGTSNRVLTISGNNVFSRK